MKSITITARSENGRIVADNPNLLKHAIAELDGKEIEITIAKRVKRRSLDSNNYYWVGVVQPIWLAFREFGNDYTKDDVHEFLLQKFWNEPVIDPKSGEIIGYKAKRSSSMTQEEFTEHINKSQAWGSEALGIEWMDRP